MMTESNVDLWNDRTPARTAGFLADPSRRIAAYALLLTIVSAWCCFYRLSEGTLFGDEATFACTTDRMIATGDWVVPYFGGQPHLNATPLYNWLTMAIRPWFDDAPLWHRFWPSLFGIGCVLATFALGTISFRAEVGLLAGLLLAFNRDFLFCHGVRFAGMDSMLAFFITAAVICYAWLLTRPTHTWLAWGSMGVCIGLAALTKPPIFCGVIFGAIGFHQLFLRRGEPWFRRVAGPLLALAVCVVVAAPWYALLWFRQGDTGLHALFVHNSVERALDPQGRDFFWCHFAITHSSNSFKLVEPALAFALAACAFGWRRPQCGALLLVAGSLLLALSVAGKYGQYTFYVFPILAVLLAVGFLETGPRLAARFWPRFAANATIFGVGLAVVLVGADCLKTLNTLGRPIWIHPPVGFYERLLPELESRTCRLVLVDFPSSVDATKGIGSGNFEDVYYTPRLPLIDRVRDVAELRSLLEDGKPAIVFLPPLTQPQPRLDGLAPDLRVENNRWPAYVYPVLAFHGAADKFTTAELNWICRGSAP